MAFLPRYFLGVQILGPGGAGNGHDPGGHVYP